jgi:hypothetical protein
VYPNPATSIIKVDDSNFSLKNIEVFNLLGKKLIVTTKNQLNVKNLVSGVYVIKVEDNDGNIAKKRIIKQ